MKSCIQKVLCSLIIMCLSFTSVSALSNGDKVFIMREIVAGLMTKTQGRIGNDEYFNGKGGGMYDDFKIMIDERSREFVYCIEPGVVSMDNSQYQGSSASYLFMQAYNSKTSADSKFLNVSKLLQLVQKEHRYDNGSAETRLHYLVVQTLIWEVMCEERNEQFIYIGPKAGRTPITHLLSGNHSTYLNRFNELYEEYETKMFKFSTVPSFTSSQKNKAPTIYLGQFDEKTKEYYTIVEDKNGVVEWFEFRGDSKVRIEKMNNKVKIICSIADYTAKMSGYNRMILGDATNPKSYVIGHSQGSNQALVSLASISEQKDGAFFNIRTDNYMGTLTINSNGGIYEGRKDSIVIKKLAGEVTPISKPTRTGFTFSHWQLTGVGTFKNNRYTHSKGQATLTAYWKNNTPEITTPIVGNDGPFIEGNDLVLQLGDKFNALDYVSAYDKEDGNITSKIKVVENEVRVDESKNTIQSGRFKVVFQVTDLGGATAKKTIYVIVNDPPVIKATDRYFFVGDEVSDAMLLQGAEAHDKEDGIISSKVVISNKNFNSQEEGIGEVIFSVTDRYRKTVYKPIRIHFLQIKDRESEKTIRYIGNDYLSSLLPQSKWKVNGSMYQTLKESLDKVASDESSIYVFEWSREENEVLKEKMLGDGQVVDLSFFNAYRKR